MPTEQCKLLTSPPRRGGACPAHPFQALASILFYPFNPFFNLWGLGYLLRVSCSPGLHTHTHTHPREAKPRGSLRSSGRWQQWH